MVTPTNIPCYLGNLSVKMQLFSKKAGKLKKKFWFSKKWCIFAFGFGDESNGPGRFPVKNKDYERESYCTEHC